MRMISADSLETIVLLLLVPEDRHTRPPGVLRVGHQVDLVEPAVAVEMVRPGLVELPAFEQHVRLDHRNADHVGQLLQLAEDQGAVRPGAGERDIEVIAAGLGLEAALAGRAGGAVGRHPVAKLRFGRGRTARRRRSGRAADPICHRRAVPCDLPVHRFTARQPKCPLGGGRASSAC